MKATTDYDILKMALLKRIQKNPQETLFAQLLTWQYLQQREFDQALNQALALSRRKNDDGTTMFLNYAARLLQMKLMMPPYADMNTL